MKYFIADTHFGHRIAHIAFSRPFRSITEMDNALVDNWNNSVLPDDDVYIAGDFALCNPEYAAEIISRLCGRKHLAVGNHDKDWLTPELRDTFEEVAPFLECEVDGKEAVVCHYPMLEWPGSRHGAFLIYGHIHNANWGGTYDLIRQVPNTLNAGVDINYYCPASFKELIANTNAFYSRPFHN